MIKTTLFFLTALSVLTAPAARAQDPTISIPTEQSEAAAAEASAAPTPTRSAAAADVPKKTTPAAPKSSPSPEPAAPAGKKSGAEATVRDLESKWVASVAAHDPTVAQKVLADDYVGVSSRGQLMNKRAVLSQIKKDTDSYASTRIGKMDVRLFGNAAVVIGTSNETGKDSRGGAFNRAYRWTDTWVMRNGGWQCVASQSAQVPR